MVPTYLTEYSSTYQTNPREAALSWFQDAKYGLFLHYGLYALEGRHEWEQQRQLTHVAEYEKLKDRFTAENFDAEAIARFAVECGMKYVNITTRHHDSFCLFDTKETNFNSVNAPAKRDLVGELAKACDRHGLGLFLYYSHGRDWRHPHAPGNDRWGSAARPEYSDPEPAYATEKDHDLNIYLEFMKSQITELLSNYGPVAGIWLDGIMVPLSDKTKTPYPQPARRAENAPEFRCQELYNHIHALQPQVLIAYKQGLLGTEDFYAPEHQAIKDVDKPGEVCTTMAAHVWGYCEAARGYHKSPEEVWQSLAGARSAGFNLLLNSAPLPDGGLDPEDVGVLRAVGKRLADEGFPS